MEYPKHWLPEEGCLGEWAGIRGQMLPCLPWTPDPKEGERLRCLELESLGQTILGSRQKGVYYRLTYRFQTLEPAGECSVWLKEAGARQRPSPRLGKQLWRKIPIGQHRHVGVGMGAPHLQGLGS